VHRALLEALNMLRHILVATQDTNLRALCRPLDSSTNFHLFTDVNDLLTRIAELREDLAVFVDVEWTSRQNGYHVAREVKKRHDGSKVFLLTDWIDDVTIHWGAKVNAELVERKESAFLSKLVPLVGALGLPISDGWRTYLASQAQPPTAAASPVTQAETELERILGPMGPLLLREAMTETNGNLSLALKKVAEFGTTSAERTQVANLSAQFAQVKGNP
jgi:hypothetical protein